MSDPPSMLSRLFDGLIYEYRYLDHKTAASARRLAPVLPRNYSRSWYAHEPSGVTLCWIGFCNKGCGRTLISATTKEHTRPDRYACGLCE